MARLGKLSHDFAFYKLLEVSKVAYLLVVFADASKAIFPVKVQF